MKCNQNKMRTIWNKIKTKLNKNWDPYLLFIALLTWTIGEFEETQVP